MSNKFARVYLLKNILRFNLILFLIYLCILKQDINFVF